MREHEIALQELEFAGGNARLREFAEAGVDAIKRASFGERIFQHRARTLDRVPRLCRKAELSRRLAAVDRVETTYATRAWAARRR